MSSNQKTTRPGISAEDSLKLLAAILATTVLALNLSVVRPLKDRMADLKRELVEMQSEMELLVGERDSVRNANDLLAGLKAQNAICEDARRSLTVMHQLRDEITSECQKASEVLASVEKLAVLQQTVLRYRDLTEPATKVLHEIVGLEKELIDQNGSADGAIDSVNRLTALKRNLMAEGVDASVAESGLAQLTALKTQILSQTEDLSTAVARAKQLVDVKNQILAETDDIDYVKTAVDGLLALKDQIAARGSAVQDALKNAGRLLGLRDRLAGSATTVAAAEQSASKLIDIQNKLTSASPNLAEAIKSFETLVDLQHEFQKEFRSLDGMRRGLMEVVLLENTVTRAVHMLQPLLELGNLRHLDPEELRQIARGISEQRTARVSTNDSGRGPTRAESGLGRSQFIPTPPAKDHHEDVVPWPNDED